MQTEMENRHPDAEREVYRLKPPCRCGGYRFVEPKMKITNCLPICCRECYCNHGCCGCCCCGGCSGCSGCCDNE